MPVFEIRVFRRRPVNVDVITLSRRLTHSTFTHGVQFAPDRNTNFGNSNC